MRITAVLTSHNRVAKTLECLSRLAAAALQAGVELSAVLVDDASTDGTPRQVSAQFPWVTVVLGDGSLFWNRGMHLAMETALRDCPHADHLLWINDDTDLLPDALARLLATEALLRPRLGRPPIVVGATSDRSTGMLTYGGNVAAGPWRRFSFRKVFDESAPQPCHTMNGNIVLLPMAVVKDVGNLDPVFAHAMGDIDYGLRARRRGHPIYVAPGFVGHCSNNPLAHTFSDRSLPLRTRWRKLVHRKGLPPRSWLQLTRRHGGWLWPAYFLSPYARVVCTALWPDGIRRK